jgi:hypothetical protein
MKKHAFPRGKPSPIANPMGIAAVLLAAALGGCADTHWERAVYQGARYGSTQCQLQRRPENAPCAELVDYDRYEQERTKAGRQTALPSESHPIEEVQR